MKETHEKGCHSLPLKGSRPNGRSRESKIAKNNIEWKEQYKKVDNQLESFFKEKICKEHKQTCQRWLEFFKEDLGYFWDNQNDADEDGYLLEYNKLVDLKQAIKLYDEAGI